MFFFCDCNNYLELICDSYHSIIIYKKRKKNQGKNTSSIPGKIKTTISFNKNNFVSKILNEYFSMRTWKLVELRHIILRILFDNYKFT